MAFEEADFGPERFDRILAVHVAPFYRPPAPAPPIARELLAPGGRLGIFSRGSWRTETEAEEFAASLGACLAEHGFVAELRLAQLESGPAAGALARRADD